MGVRFVFTIFIILSSQILFSQENKDSVEFVVIVRDQQNDSLVFNADLEVYFGNYKNLICKPKQDENGEFKFKINFNEFKGRELIINASKCHYISNAPNVLIDSLKIHYWEIYIQKAICHGMGLPSLEFDKNNYDNPERIDDLNFMKSIVEEETYNNFVIIARYNFDEKRTIAEKRLEYVKSKFEELQVDLSNVTYKVMASDYVYEYLNDDCETIYYSKERFEKADQDELKWFERYYQCVELRNEEWE